MDQDHEALRRRAFSRDGTAEDLRMLARLQGAGPGPTEPLPAREEAAQDAVRPRRPRHRTRLVVAAAAGLLVGAVLGTAATRLWWAPAPTVDATDSLRVFDRPARDLPDDVVLPADWLGGRDAEVRYLGTLGDAHVFAARTVASTDGGTVCLGIVQQTAAGAACTTVDEFRRSGMSTYQGELGVGWGPRGDDLWTPPPLDVG